ncbi:IS transposase [Streptomyces bottropensis ATCC 25435]|uniref:IS transposase n=1 Tax=Streptomyces bottropensis ATCC 25435 TaxID=1054862 RepID=M3DKF9_9ACTN|nr:IS transposase [Streptomyces bottropensis ATCC 25435]
MPWTTPADTSAGRAQDHIDAGARPGTTSEESAELKRLKKENAELIRSPEDLAAPQPPGRLCGPLHRRTPDA